MQNKTFRVLFLTSLCIAAIGCYATIAQVMLIREFLNIFYGNELCLGIVFGAWFLGIAAGAFAGAKIEHTFKHAFTVFVITLMVLCFVLPVQIVSVRGIRGLLSVGVGEYISILPLLLTSIGLILPFSLVIGFLFPFSAKVISGASRDAAVDVGVVYIIESMGSLFGGLVFSFFLVSRFHPFKIITLLNVGMFVLLTFSLLVFSRKGHVSGGEESKKTKRVLGLISLGMALVMIVVWFSPIPDSTEALSAKMRWKTLNPHIELMTSADSKYQHIDIGRQAEQYSIYLNGQYASAFPNEYEYAQIAHLVMTQHPSPKHVLLIGNGLGGLISEMLLHPIESLDYVELDQRLLQISDKYLSPSDRQALSDSRVTTIYQDGRYYVKNTPKRQHYGIILVNTPDPSTAFLNRFYTLEFFRETQKILKPDGVLIASVSSAVTYIGKEVGSYTGSLYRTLHEAFQDVLVTPGQTNFYFACNKDGIITLDIETLMERYRKSQVKSDYFTEYLFYTMLQPEQVKFIESQLGQRKNLLVNTDARPVTYFLNLVLWDSLTGGCLHGLFHGLKDVKLQWFLIPIVIALAGRIIYVILSQFRLRRKGDKHEVSQHQREKGYSPPAEKDNLKITTPSSPPSKGGDLNDLKSTTHSSVARPSHPSERGNSKDSRADIPLSPPNEGETPKTFTSTTPLSPPCEGGDEGVVIKFKTNQPESVEEFNHYYIKQLKTNCLIALTTTGFTGIALEIVLLYAFQNIYGYIYERMGVIVAVFMVGLALGGYFMNQIIKKTRNRSTDPSTGSGCNSVHGELVESSRRSPKSKIPNHCLPPTGVDSYRWVNLLMVFEGVIGFYAIILPFIIHALSSYSIAAEVGLTCFIGIAGVLTGLEFPLVNKIFMRSSGDMAISAGVTYSADHIGAILGAILTGVIFVPLLGVFGTCLILAVLKISSLVSIAFSIFLHKRIRGKLL